MLTLCMLFTQCLLLLTGASTNSYAEGTTCEPYGFANGFTSAGPAADIAGTAAANTEPVAALLLCDY
jgi:hypothetical protein